MRDVLQSSLTQTPSAGIGLDCVSLLAVEVPPALWSSWSDPAVGGRKCGLGSAQDPGPVAPSSGSSSPHEPLLAIGDASLAAGIPGNGGGPFCTTTVSLLWPPTSSPYRRSHFTCCLASWLSSTGRRRILHSQITKHPPAAWLVQHR